MSREKIGILAGSFDPIHKGHIAMARAAVETAGLDRVLFVPVDRRNGTDAVADHVSRWQMTVAACTEDPRFQPADIAEDHDIAELPALAEGMFPKDEISFIIGADQFADEAWKKVSDETRGKLKLLVCPRPAADPLLCNTIRKQFEKAGSEVKMLRMVPVTVSSTQIRETLAEGKTTSQLHVAVREYIACKGLYGISQRIPEADIWIGRLFDSQKPSRFAHSLSVAYTSRRLARIHGIDSIRAEQAGLLHDCAKCIPLKQMQQIAKMYHLTDDPTINENAGLLHSYVGEYIAERDYGMKDPEVLQAIRYHNTGNAGMTILDICVCLSDSIEPCRANYPGLEKIRVLSELSLERALLLSLERTAEYVAETGKALHPKTAETITWLKSLQVNK